MPFLSFREFLYLEGGEELPVYNPFQPSSNLPIQPNAALLTTFNTYRSIGSRSF